MSGFDYIAESWRGIQKIENQDGFHVITETEYTLFFIFDGVSASKNSAEGIQELIHYCNNNYKTYYRANDYSLSDLIEDLNLVLLRSKLEAPETTCVLLFLNHDGSRMKISHLGDSRLYHFLNGKFLPLTEDHSHPEIKNMLTKCLGLSRLKEDDFYEKSLIDPIGSYLLCTDGFYNVMEVFQDEFNNSFLYYKDLGILKKKIETLVRFRNGDDATYIYIRLNEE